MGESLIQFRLDIPCRPQEVFPRRHEVGRRINSDMVAFRQDLASHAVDLLDLFHFIAKQRNPDYLLVRTRRKHFDHIAPHAERTPVESHIVAVVLDFDQFAQDVVPVPHLPLPQRQHHIIVLVRRTEAVDAGHAGHDDDVAPLEQGAGGRMAEFVDLVVDGGIFFDVGVGRHDIRFRLIVIIIADEVFHRVVWEKFLELAGQLRRQRFVMRNHQRRLLHRLDDFGHREGFACPCRPQQHLRLISPQNPCRQFSDRLRLVAQGNKRSFHLKRRHYFSLRKNRITR